MRIVNRFDLQIANELTELRRMSEWLRQSSEYMGLPEPVIMDLDVCANEAVANTISYGYRDDDRHDIYLRLELTESRAVRLTIEDDAVPFNPFEAPSVLPFDNIENAKIGGLGVHLVRSLMDECHYRHADGRNIITLIANASRQHEAGLKGHNT